MPCLAASLHRGEFKTQLGVVWPTERCNDCGSRGWAYREQHGLAILGTCIDDNFELILETDFKQSIRLVGGNDKKIIQ